MTLWLPPKKPLYAPMLATFGGGSAQGFKRKPLESGGGGTPGANGSAVNQLDILNDGSCVACLNMESALDLGGNSVTSGTSGGGLQTSVNKWGTKAWYVPDGSASNYIFVANMDLSGGGGSYTLSAWFRLASIRSSGIQPVLMQVSGTGTGSLPSNGAITVADNGSYGKGLSSSTSLDPSYDTGQTVTTGIWYHGVHTYNASTSEYKMYLNNSLVQTVQSADQTGNQPPPLDDSTAVDVLVGHEPDSFNPFGDFAGSQCLSGYVDQVRIFDKAVNSTEVGYLFNEQLLS